MTAKGVETPITLSNGLTVPALGYGTWQAPKGEVAVALKLAIKAGFRHIDCAKIYRNEEEIGTALKELFAEGVVKREDLFITTKLWNTDHDPKVVEIECRKSMERLQLDYLDLYLIHWPVSHVYPENGDFSEDSAFFPRNDQGGCHQHPVPLVDTWKAMESLVEKKLTRSIGVSNFSSQQCAEICAAATIKPVMNQVEVHPALPQKNLQKRCAELGITLTAYCPLGLGLKHLNLAGLHNDEQIIKIAEAEGVKPAEMLLRWGLQIGNVVLTKSVTPSRIEENAATLAGGLSEATMKKLEEYRANLKSDGRVGNPNFFLEKEQPLFDGEE